MTEAHRLLHGGENECGGMRGIREWTSGWRLERLDVEWRVAMRPGRRRHLEPGSYEALAEKRKASVRAKVEHPVPVREAALWLRQGALPRVG